MADAKNYAQRNQRGSDWFSHDGNAAAATTSPTHKAQAEPALPESAAKSKNGAVDGGDSTRTQMIKPKCDSNQWFKHEKKDVPDAGPVSPVHEKKDETPAAGSKSDATQSVKGRDSREGDSYGRRDKMGSSGTWFAHDHTDAGAATGGGTPRCNTKEGGDNANRMRGESENWYNYDANKGGATAPQDLHVAKGRSNRPQNDEMHGIFHHGK